MRSFSDGKSSLTSTAPSNSSCSFCSTGVWLDGEKGGVATSCASAEVEIFGSALEAESEGGGDGSALEVGWYGAGATAPFDPSTKLLLFEAPIDTAMVVGGNEDQNRATTW